MIYVVIVLIALVSILLGVFCGAILYRRFVLKRFEMVQPLLGNAIADLFTKAMTESMTSDEMKAYLNDEVNFIKLIMK